jgi:hypothetical protein
MVEFIGAGIDMFGHNLGGGGAYYRNNEKLFNRT